MFNVICDAKLRISEQNAKRKTKYLPFAFSSERNFDEVTGLEEHLPAPRLYLILNFAC